MIQSEFAERAINRQYHDYFSHFIYMCGRFAMYNDPLRLAEYFQAAGGIEFTPSFNIAPSSQIITVTADAHGQRQLNRMHWGLIPGWAKDPTIGNKLANARGETVAEKPSFRSAFKARRCLIPASGFFEWKNIAGKKHPWYITFKSGEPLAMAGIWETWRAPGADPIVSCCIITTDANELMQPIHDRMPVILDRDQWESWLSPAERNTDQLQTMIHPHESAFMLAWPVSRELNRVGQRDDAGLIDPIEAQQSSLI